MFATVSDKGQVTLPKTLREQMAEASKLDSRIREALAGAGHGW